MNLTLREPRSEDAMVLTELIKDPEIMNSVPGSDYLNGVDEFREFLADVSNTSGFGTERHFVICLNDKPIGLCALHEINNKNAKIGYWIGRKYWGKGYGKNAVSLLIQIAGSLGIEKVIADSKIDNERSARLLESLNFKKIESSAQGLMSFVLIIK